MNAITTNLQNAQDFSSATATSTPSLDYGTSYLGNTVQYSNSNSNNTCSGPLDEHKLIKHQNSTTPFANSYLTSRFSSISSSGSSSASSNSTQQLRNVINQSNQVYSNNQTSINSIHRLSSASSCSLSSSKKSHQSTTSSFANKMIAKLSTGSSLNAARQAPQSSAQSKRKRSKLLDILLNSNWSKHNQQASYLMKLNKILLVCDANFLDERTGESPLSLAIDSSQINSALTANANSSSTNQTSHFGSLSNPMMMSCPQSASLFNLTAQSTEPITRHVLQQTSISDLSQSKAPLIERILLLLVKSGALIDFRNSDGRTPLHVAAMKSNFWALKTLLELGK